MSAHIGVVGGDDETSRGPPVIAVPAGGPKRGYEAKSEQNVTDGQAPAPARIGVVALLARVGATWTLWLAPSLKIER